MGPTISRRDFRTGRDNGLPSFNQRVNTFSGDTRPTNNTFPGIRATATSWFAGALHSAGLRKLCPFQQSTCAAVTTCSEHRR